MISVIANVRARFVTTATCLLTLFLALSAAQPAMAEDFFWTGTAGGYWGGLDWNEGSVFVAGGNAVFTNSATGSVLVDTDVTANKVEARENTTISPGTIDPDAWKTAYSYYRFCVDAPKSDGYSMQLSDVMLLDASGSEIPSTAFTLSYDSFNYGLDSPYPSNENPANAADGNHDTKWLDWRAGASRTAVQRAAVYIEFQFPSAVNLSGYRWYTANDSDGRDPVAWRLLASHDGASWVTLDKVTGFNPIGDRKVLAFQRTFAGFSKYRFKVDETRDTNDSMMQLSDISLYGEDGVLLLNGVDFTISWDMDMKGTSNNYGDSGTETPRHVVDTTDGAGNVNTKWLDRRIKDYPDYVWIQFDMAKPVNITAYSWSTANDADGRDPRDWRLLGSADGTTWAPVDYIANTVSVPTTRKVLAYSKQFTTEGMSFKIAELNAAADKTLLIQDGLDISNTAGISKTGAGTLALGDGGGISINPANGFAVCEGTLAAADVTFRLGGTATANSDAPFVVGNEGSATAVLDGGSVYCVSVGSGDYNAMQIGAKAGDVGYLYATNATVTARGRIRLATGEGSFAYVDKVGGDWRVQENSNYGRFYMGQGLNSSSEFYHRSGTLETWSYFCIGSNDSSASGRNYFELSGGTVTQGYSNDVRIGDKGEAGVTNELCVKGGTFNARTDIRIGYDGPGTMTIDGGNVNAGSGQVIVSHSSGAGETGTVSLNGGVLLTKGVVYGGGVEHGILNLNGGTLKASASGTLIGGGDSLEVYVGTRGGTIDNNGMDVTVESSFCLDEGFGNNVTFVGAGTTEFTVDQVDSQLSFTISEGVAKISEGVSISPTLRVASGARLTAPASINEASRVSNLALDSGAEIGLSASAKGIEVDTLTMPYEGTVTLASSAGAPLDMGIYVVLAGCPFPEGIEDMFVPNVADGLQSSFSFENDALVLTVFGGNQAVWTGSVDGDMANLDNWFLRLSPDGRPVVINVATNATLTCSASLAPTSITFSEGSAAITINSENGASISDVAEVVNLSSNVQTFNVPVSFAQDVALNYSDAPVDFAGGATGRTLVLTGLEDGGWHLRGTFNLETWQGAYCFIDAGATVNAATASGLGDVRVEVGGSLVVGDYALNVTDSAAPVKWVLYYNKGLFAVTNALTNTSSVRTSMFSDNSGEPNTSFYGTNIIEHLVNTPTAGVEFLFGKYGNADTGFNEWVRATYQFGAVTWGEMSSPIVGWRQCQPRICFAKTSTLRAVASGQYIGCLEGETYGACDIYGNPSDITLDCDISYVPFYNDCLYDVTLGGGGRFMLAAGRTIDRYGKNVAVAEGTTLALVPGSNIKASGLAVDAGSSLEIATSGDVSFNASLSLTDGAALAFNFTSRSVAPVLNMTGKSVTANGTVYVKVSAAELVHPSRESFVLTSGGGFASANVVLDSSSPKWVKGVSVVDGDIVISVKPAGTVFTVR